MLIFGEGLNNRPKKRKKKCGCGGKCDGNCTCGARKPNTNYQHKHLIP